jgi:hypothetical protein
VATGIQERADLVILAVANHDDLFSAHAADDKVAGIGELAFVAQEQPASLEDLFHFLLKNLRVYVKLSTYRPVRAIDVRGERIISECTHNICHSDLLSLGESYFYEKALSIALR